MTTALRVGLVGTGLWAREVHAAALLAHPDVEFVGVWGRDRDRARAIADPARIAAFDTVAALLEAVEAVTIAIPPAAQAPIALEAARAGKHVMMEKPVAMTAALADELEAAVLQRGVGSVVCFTGRWIPQFEQWLTSLAGQDGWACGRAEILSNAMVTTSGFETSPWRQQFGALWDLGPHGLSMLHPVLGDVESVAAIRGVNDQVHLLLRHAGEASSTLSASMTLPAAVRPGHAYYFYGGPGRSSAPSLDGDADPTAIAYGRMLDSLVAQARDGTRDDPRDVRLGAHVVRVLEAASTSLSTGSVTPVPRPVARR